MASEFIGGCVHFVSNVYILPVVHNQLALVHYPNSLVIICISCAVGSIVCGVVSNLPVILAPPPAITIFFMAALDQNNLNYFQGSQAVIISGVLLTSFAYRPLGLVFKNFIPPSIQFSTAVGLGLVIALAGLTDVGFVVDGNGIKLLRDGPVTPGPLISSLKKLHFIL